MTQEQIMSFKEGLLINALLTFLFGQKRNVVEYAEILMLEVKNVAKDEHYFTFFFAQLAYILKNNEFSPEEESKYFQKFKNTKKMNAYDRLQKQFGEQAMKEGREQGREQGREEGREQGREEGQELLLMKLVDRQLSKGFSISEIAERLDIDINDVITIINKYKLQG